MIRKLCEGKIEKFVSYLEYHILPQLIVCPQTILPECGPILSLDETSSTVEEFPQSLFFVIK